jgi:hypothetical protein
MTSMGYSGIQGKLIYEYYKKQLKFVKTVYDCTVLYLEVLFAVPAVLTAVHEDVELA